MDRARSVSDRQKQRRAVRGRLTHSVRTGFGSPETQMQIKLSFRLGSMRAFGLDCDINYHIIISPAEYSHSVEDDDSIGPVSEAAIASVSLVRRSVINQFRCQSSC